MSGSASSRTPSSHSWQWVCHIEKLREPGAYVTTTIAGQSIMVVRDKDGTLRAFYNVCKHRAHELLQGEGTVGHIMCPYHAWAYRLDGWPQVAPHTKSLKGFDKSKSASIRSRSKSSVASFTSTSTRMPRLAEQSGDLRREIMYWALEVDELTFGHRLTYDIKSNWKNVVDNFLECYHCPTAHKDFCTLVDMDTYKVTTHGIYSSHMADAGQGSNTAYDVSNAVRTHAVWWLYPTTCIMRYLGRPSMIILNIIPIGPDRTLETYDFFLVDQTPDEAEVEAIRYLDEVLQVEDIGLVESVQRGMNTPASSRDGSSMTPMARASRARRPSLPRAGAGCLQEGTEPMMLAGKQRW